ncbi:uncharacterized protein LOC127788221 [Diospyros lotus]|uniref:uncharacterized protein LOC127788221 n=1 Tax=Diospyros lotus TaxID=55363 RepID=UPI0022542BAB|nr:uncharacterized protein LOC127788221 [Diospyros lotus]
MTEQLTTKSRRVKCPRCRRVLLELPNIPIYQCGGCGTFLQAKKRKNDSKDTGSDAHQTDGGPKIVLEHLPNDKEARSLIQGEVLPSARESSLDKIHGSGQIKISDSNREHSGDIKFSGELSTEVIHHRTEVPESAVEAETEIDQDECSLEQNKQDRNEFGYLNEKLPGGISFSTEIASSTELDRHQSEESSLVAGVHREMGLNQNDGSNQNGYRYCNSKEPAGTNSDEVASSTEISHHGSEESSPFSGVQSEVDQNSRILEQINGRNQTAQGDYSGMNHSECGDYKTESNENMKISDEVTSSVIRTFCTELAPNFKSQFGSLSEESVLASSPKGSNITARKPLSESILTDNHTSPCIEQLEQSQESGLDRVSSVDAMENIALASPSSEFSALLRHMPKSPTTKSYYAYDGSDSSYDGTDDHHNRHISKRKLKEAVSTSSRTMPRRDEIMNKITSRYPEIQHRSSISSENKNYPVEGSKWSQDELLESRKCGHPVRSRKKYERDEWLPKGSFYSRSAQVGYENGSLSDYGQSEFQSITGFHSPSRSEYQEEEKLEQLKWVNKEKMELLKMVYELQDQLHRTRIVKEKTNERFPGVSGKEKQISPHHEYEVPEPEIFHNLSNTRYNTRFNQGRSWPHQSQVARIPFSAEASIIRNQFDCSCLNCSPQDWQGLAPSLPHVCCNRNQYTAHPSQRSQNLYHSGPSSQRHYTGSEFSSGGCDAKSEDHWYTNQNELQKYTKERRHLAKRHVRPLAGGTPFLTCYNCLEILQLPADFLVFRKRCHQLRCSACSFALKFSLQNRTHLVPYSDFAADVIAPLPSEVDTCSNSNNREKLVSLSHANNYPDAGPASCSDDHGPSLNKTSSTEGESFAVGLPFHAIGRGSNDRKASFDRSPSKLSSEIEELPPLPSSPLHRLMGYSSPSEVMDN